jgi:hypothetical protein
LPNEDGELIDPITDDVLNYASDILQTKKMMEKKYFDKTMCVWTIVFMIKKVVKFEEAKPISESQEE